MSLEQYAYISQIAGVILIVVSLAYVAKQLRQNTEIMRAASRNEVIHSQQQELRMFLEHPEVWRGVTGSEMDDAAVRLHTWLTAHFRAREHEWFQFRRGALDQTAWKSYSSPLPLVLSRQTTRDWWELMKQAFDGEFVEQVNKLVEESDLRAIRDLQQSTLSNVLNQKTGNA